MTTAGMSLKLDLYTSLTSTSHRRTFMVEFDFVKRDCENSECYRFWVPVQGNKYKADHNHY